MGKKDDALDEIAGKQSKKIKNWIIDLDKLLTDGGCRTTIDAKGNLTYISKKTKKAVCRILIVKSECKIKLHGKHFENKNNIVAELPKNMIDIMKKGMKEGGGRNCAECTSKCQQGGYKYTYNGEKFSKCWFFGFTFIMDETLDIELIKKWLELELAWY